MVGTLIDILNKSDDVIIIDPGGFTLPFISAQAALLSESSKNITVYSSHTINNEDLLLETAKLSGFDVSLFKISRSTGISTLRSVINYFLLFWGVFKKTRKKSCYVILNFGVISLLDMMMLLSVNKDKRIFICHNPVEHGKNRIELGHILRSIVAGKVVILSRYSEKLYKRLYPKFLHKKIHRIDLGEMFAKASARDNLPDFRVPEKNLIFFGNIKPYKDAQFILEIAKSLPDYKVEVFGRGASLLFKQVTNNEVIENINIHDEFLSGDKLDSLLRGNGIFILSHEHATQSGVLWLLKTYKCNFIISRIPGLTQDIPHEAARLISFKKRSVDGVKQALNNYQVRYVDIHKSLYVK